MKTIRINNSNLILKIGDITEEFVDVIVNAANNRLLPGGGVCGAIHKAAGNKLAKECETIGFCDTGKAIITKGYNLKAEYVIHTVGPIYSKSESDSIMLRKCYENSLKLAEEKNLKSIAFPSISTGIFGYPVKEAALIAIGTIIDFLENCRNLEIVKMILFSENDYNEYKNALNSLIKR